MNKKTISIALFASLIAGAGGLIKYDPCIVQSPICESHLQKLGALKDADDPYFLSFGTPWLAQPAKILYPAYAMDQGLTGVAKLELRVDADGKLIEKSISESSGHKILDEAALTAANTFVFNPAGFGNVLFPYSKELKIRFELAGEAK